MKNCTVIFALVSIFSACSHKNDERNFSKIEFEKGDLAFRKGISAKSHAVQMAETEGIYSHCGIVVKDSGNFKIVRLTPGERENGETADKIKMEAYGEFWRKYRAQYGAVYRLKNNYMGANAAQKAKRLLQKQTLFDHDYNLNDTTEMSCTKFGVCAYQLAGKDISFGKRSVVENVPNVFGDIYFPVRHLYERKIYIDL